MPRDCLTVHSGSNDCLQQIEAYYNDIGRALVEASRVTVPEIPCRSLKPFWSSELDNLKQDSIFWHDIWVSAGRPASGELQRIKAACKLKYKQGIKTAYETFERQNNDALYEHFLEKNTSQFWKSWHSRFYHNITKRVVLEGCNNDEDIAEIFADYFSHVYNPKSADDSPSGPSRVTLDSASEEFIARLSVEQVDKAVRNLEFGKACGPDNLSAEHLMYAHPSLIIHMRLLFHMFLVNAVVPEKFGEGFIIPFPLVKDKSGNLNNVANYRGITLVPIISKVLEGVINALCLSCFETDDHQFGFKKGKGCTDAIYLFTATVDHFIEHGSSVFVAALDISKAFDKVDHTKLLASLGEAGIPSCVVNIL